MNNEKNSGLSYGGWVNDHAHLDKGLLATHHDYTDVAASQRGVFTRDLKKRFTVADIRERATILVEQMIAAGTVYVRTHVDVDPVVGLKGIEALLEVKEKFADRLILEITVYNQEGFTHFPEVPELLREAMRMGVKGIGGHTSIDPNGRLHIDRTIALALECGAEWIEFHVDEMGSPGHFLLPYLGQKVLSEQLGPMVTAIHCNSLAYVSETAANAAIDLIARTGMQVTICPTAIATRKLAPVKKLLDAGIHVRLGSDNIADLFNPLGSCNMLQYAQLLAYVQRFFEPNDIQQLVNMITRLPDRDHIHIAVEKMSNQIQYDVANARELIALAPLPVGG